MEQRWSASGGCSRAAGAAAGNGRAGGEAPVAGGGDAGGERASARAATEPRCWSPRWLHPGEGALYRAQGHVAWPHRGSNLQGFGADLRGGGRVGVHPGRAHQKFKEQRRSNINDGEGHAKFRVPLLFTPPSFFSLFLLPPAYLPRALCVTSSILRHFNLVSFLARKNAQQLCVADRG